MVDVSIYDPNMFVWLDETGCVRSCANTDTVSFTRSSPADSDKRYSASTVLDAVGIVVLYVMLRHYNNYIILSSMVQVILR